jgi:mannose-6-phosphate isomerase-like protein (cupin superfamily)
VMPSDHAINDEGRFSEAVRRAAKVAATGRLVLFGIQPNQPETGYGYIRQGAALEGFNGGAFKVDSFYEKPNAKTAQSYLAAGNYFWNSGIFVLHARTFLEELARLDYAVMEKTTAAAMLPIDVGWSDVGSWSSLWDIAPRDQANNYVHGEAVLEDTHNCYVHSERGLVATIGVQDLIIVDTPDALLVADKSRSQDVSKIVARLRQSNRKEQEQHLRNYRPWGYFETLNVGTRFQVKLLHVKPGGKLSMQMHHHRSEHWVVVQGTANVVVGDMDKLLRENESVYIFATQWHRLENPGKVPLEIIEVQIGTYLGEDDIVRTDDVYHRAPEETR